MTYDVSIRIPRDKSLPDVIDWLEVENDYQWKRDWTYGVSRGSADFTFMFNEQASAVLFALRWS